MFDVFFISYDETNANDNYNHLQTIYNKIIRVNGIKGILNAHKKCAELSNTSHFFVVDADNYVYDNFNFKCDFLIDDDSVYVWRCKNHVNDLIYGYGAIKLLPTKILKNINITTIDMTTSISSNYKIINDVISETRFDTSPFETWKSAFRECVKLSSKIINNQINKETEERLNIWCNNPGKSKFGHWCVFGANEGKKYGIINKNNKTNLNKINDFTWLQQYFNNKYGF